MALVTPIVNDIPAFDATELTEITFTANGGDQIVKNEIQIINNATNVVVYSNTQTTYTLGQIIPANTLVNGNYYKVAFRTYDILDNASEWSNYQPFYCYSLPTLSFNISDGQTIYTQNFNLTLTYNQTENERLKSAVVYYYDSNNNLISSSGNLFNSNYPPVSFNYPLKDFENNKTYRIKADATTVYGTFITTGLISFYVNYQTIDNEGELYFTLDSCNGYLNIKSSLVISAVKGQNAHSPSQLPYVFDSMADLTSVVGVVDEENSYSHWIKWYDLTPVSDALLFRLWFYPARTSFKVAELVSTDENNHITITFNRGEMQDYISINTDDGTHIDKELGVICNGNTKVFLWVKVIGNTWDVQTEILSNPATILEWNNNDNNSIYNVSTDISYRNESYGNFISRRNVYRALSGAFDTVIVGNGIFDGLDLSININRPYSSDMPQHDISAVLFVTFDGDIDNNAPTGYTKATLQRKDSTMITWFNLSDIEISSDIPTQIDYNDYLIPSGVQQTYGLTLYKGDLPSDTYTVNIVPKWGRVFLSDKDESYKLNYSVIYSNGSQNIQNGVLMPISATYPTVIQNAEGNYRSGSLQFKVLGYQFDIDKTLDRNSIVKQTDDILAFLTNRKPKCIKDYNGNIFICKVINSPQISYDANWGNGISTISFDWVEQAKYNKYDEMVEMNIIDNNIPTPTPPVPPEPPTPTPVEPFVERVYLPNGNNPDTIYPTQGIYEYNMYFGEIEAAINSANFYMPSDDYNIISYKMNNMSQAIPQKQYSGNDCYYILEFRESTSGSDNGSIEIVVRDNNNNEISYTFNFIYELESDFVHDSINYINTQLEVGFNLDSGEFYKFVKKNDNEAYMAFIETNHLEGSFGWFITPVFVSDNPSAVEFICEVYRDGELINQYEYSYSDTCEYNNKTWYISKSSWWAVNRIENIQPYNLSNLLFVPDDDSSINNLSKMVTNLLYHIYEYPPLDGNTSTLNDVQKWLKCGNIWGKNYTEVNNVVEDNLVTDALLNSENASNYLVRQTGVNWVFITYSYLIMYKLGQCNYCANLLLFDETWRNYICNSYYYYSVLNVSNPMMTDNITPSGECFCVPDNNVNAYKAFDHSQDNVYILSSQIYSDSFIGYKFPKIVNVYKIGIAVPFESYQMNSNINMTIQGSRDGISWDDILVVNDYIPTAQDDYDFYNVAATSMYYRVLFSKPMRTVATPTGTYYQSAVTEVAIYGREDI